MYVYPEPVVGYEQRWAEQLGWCVAIFPVVLGLVAGAVHAVWKQKGPIKEVFVLNLPISPLPDDKILDVTKLNAFIKEKIKVAKIRIFLFDRKENTVGKGENAGHQHFLLFPQCFPKPSS